MKQLLISALLGATMIGGVSAAPTDEMPKNFTLKQAYVLFLNAARILYDHQQRLESLELRVSALEAARCTCGLDK